MKLLAFTDLHLSTEALKKVKEKVKKSKPDLLVCAGDLTIFENGLNEMLKRLSKIKKNILLIHGNHETASSMRKICSKYDNLIFIHNKHHIIDDYLFLGHGGGGFSIVDKGFKKIGKNFKKIIKKNKGKKTILITHAPPYKTKLDFIIDQHCGNKSIRKFIEKNKINLHLSGHLHENFRKKDTIKKTETINPGPYGKVIRV